MTQLINLLVAVALHKWAEALTLVNDSLFSRLKIFLEKGMSFSKNESRKNLSIRMIIIFSSTGPLGIGIGCALTQTSPIISAVFMSISAGLLKSLDLKSLNKMFIGTFLYISASEVVVEEFSISKNKWLKLLFFMIGVAMISGLWFLEESD